MKKRTSYQHGKLRAMIEKNQSNIPLLIALECFFSSVISEETRLSYMRSFEALINNKIISFEWSLEDFKHSNLSAILKQIKSNLWIKPGMKRSMSIALSSFVTYLNTELETRLNFENDLIDSERNAFDTEIDPLNIEEWELFITALRQHNPRDALIAEILQLANGPIFATVPNVLIDEFNHEMKVNIQKAKAACDDCDSVLEPKKIRKDKPVKGTPLVSLKMVINMRVFQISFTHLRIDFANIHRGNLVLQSYPFPVHIFTSLQPFKGNETDLVFQTSNGKCLVEGQLKRSFTRAAKAAKMRHVTPTIVRTPIPGLLYCPHCYKPQWKKECACMWH